MPGVLHRPFTLLFLTTLGASLSVGGCGRRNPLDTGGETDTDGETDGSSSCEEVNLSVCTDVTDLALACGEYSSDELEEARATCEAYVNEYALISCECGVAVIDHLRCVVDNGCVDALEDCAYLEDDIYDVCFDGGGEDGWEGHPKAAVDIDSLVTAGVTISVDGNLASGTVPLIGSVSALPTDHTLDLYFLAAVSIEVTSNTSGISASLDMPGLDYVANTPAFPGEYAFSLNATRDAWTVTFYNETPMGQILQVGGDYSATVSVSDNPYIEPLAPATFSVLVVN